MTDGGAGTPETPGKAKQTALGCLGLVIVLVVLAIFLAPSPKPAVRELALAGSNLNAHIVFEDLWTSASVPSMIGLEVISIGRRIQSGELQVSPETEWLQVRVDTPSIDHLGREGYSDFGNLRFPVGDLRAANYSNLDQYRILNVADDVQIATRLGMEAATEFCADESNRAQADRFCGFVDAQAER